jgi:hypothetical protein
LIPFVAYSFIQFGTFCVAGKCHWPNLLSTIMNLIIPGGFVLFFPDILNKILTAREFVENPGICEIYKFNDSIKSATNISSKTVDEVCSFVCLKNRNYNKKCVF